jgi:GntR family histidine utilization transcriptional repressor
MQAQTAVAKDLGTLRRSIHTDSESPRPIYRKIKAFIEEQILSGAWRKDMQIPSENQFVKALGISRMTVHRALRELTADGHLVRIHGVGTFVAQPRARSAFLEIQSIAEQIKSRGGTHSSQLHLLEEETPPAHLATAMGLPARAKVFHSITIHRDSGVAVQLSDRYVNPTFAPEYMGQDFSRTTPAEYLLRVGVPDEVEQTIEADMPDAKTQELLEMDRNEPCLVLHRMTWVHGLLATSSRLIWPGSRHSVGGRFRPLSRHGGTRAEGAVWKLGHKSREGGWG